MKFVGGNHSNDLVANSVTCYESSLQYNSCQKYNPRDYLKFPCGFIKFNFKSNKVSTN